MQSPFFTGIRFALIRDIPEKSLPTSPKPRSQSSQREYTARPVHSNWPSPTPISCSFNQRLLTAVSLHTLCA